ncbi:Phloem protein 2-like a1 [Thalictrum thalictroides]|uniref:Phloem protein 2-like a1 n=1 Tax=Thalictrum thalictroides TaxID=46969 RepID=A0A7J6WRW2_THATH|nr:Phloem protein 2-like a1 [Thalictrum thalictroides]
MGGTASKSGASTKTLLVAGNAKTSLVAESKIVTADLPIEGSTSHNYDDIIKSADTPLDQSSKEKLYDQLHSGVYLNKKRQKYWIEKDSGINCFMLLPRGLTIIWGDDKQYWTWPTFEEPDGVVVEMAELLKVCWLEVNGSLDLSLLSPNNMYEIVFIIKLDNEAAGWETPVTLKTRFIDAEEVHKLSLLPKPRGQWIEVQVLGDSEPDIKTRKSSLLTKPRGQWFELQAGEFYADPNIKKKHICFSLCGYEGGKWKSGLLIKGAIIRPKKRD